MEVKPMAALCEFGCGEYRGTYTPDYWRVAFFNDTYNEELADFRGTGEMIEHYTTSDEITKEQKESCWDLTVKFLRAQFGQDFNPKLPHEI